MIELFPTNDEITSTGGNLCKYTFLMNVLSFSRSLKRVNTLQRGISFVSLQFQCLQSLTNRSYFSMLK